MMVCEKCGEKITLSVYGCPPNVCWDCFEDKEYGVSINTNTLGGAQSVVIQPTMGLKFVERDNMITGDVKLVLQQEWINPLSGETMWVDVPIESENENK